MYSASWADQQTEGMVWNGMTLNSWNLGVARMATICKSCTVGNCELSTLIFSILILILMWTPKYVAASIHRGVQGVKDVHITSRAPYCRGNDPWQWFPREWTCTETVAGSGSFSLVNHKENWSPERLLNCLFRTTWATLMWLSFK